MVASLKLTFAEPDQKERLDDAYVSLSAYEGEGRPHLFIALQCSDGEMDFRCDLDDLITGTIWAHTSADGNYCDDELIAIRNALARATIRLSEVVEKAEKHETAPSL